ncbi:enoyl-CoA hydratase/isomerase family protein [Novosphingobium malaysiense]|nr:enoyl-CoA hydratase/isomerase family protein [Novosphingobium malaysiense]
MDAHEPGNDEAVGQVLYRKKDGVCTITLNCPERLNAIDHGPGSLHRDMTDAVARANREDDVGCIVVTAEGRAFSSGGFVRGEMPDDPMQWYEFLRVQDEDNERLREMDKPVIGAINGLCYGAGLIMVCNFDFLIAVDTAEFGFIEMRYGDPAAEALAYLVGPQWAKFLAITGELITAQKAKEIGLVLEVFPEATFRDKVQDLGRRIASIPTNAVVMQRRLVNCAMENMGWRNQKNTANALNALLATQAKEHKAPDGRRYLDIRNDSWAEFKKVRDAPFRPPWLERPETDG